MRVAIIGGGASGLVAAWSLAAAHEVTLFEAEPRLGGNIATVGRNVAANGSAADAASGLFLDAGVVEFPRPAFPVFHALMTELQVELATVPGTSGLFLADGRQLFSPGAILQMHRDVRWKMRAFAAIAPLLVPREAFLRRTGPLGAAELYPHRLVDFLDDGDLRTWLRLLCTYAWSIPLAEVDDIPAALGVPVVRSVVRSVEWSCVVGGAYAYVERILAQLAHDGATVRVGCPVVGVTRREDGIEVALPDGSRHGFDSVVLAVTPDRVLGLLADADGSERAWFGDWHPNEAVTILHDDPGMYRRRGVEWYSEFDLFETGPTTGGYNAYLNRLCQVPAERGQFGLAFAMDHEIDPARVVHRQLHHSPRYTVAALAHREAVRASNGRRRTWHAGAWLHDGLHEGAVVAGLAVGQALGGRGVRI